jgi:hypothetical protein
LKLLALSAVVALGACSSEDLLAPDPNYADDVSTVEFVAAKAPGAGAVAVIGGSDPKLKSSQAAEFFDPKKESFVAAGNLGASRAGMYAVAFEDGPLAGEILVPGGLQGSGKLSKRTLKFSGKALASAELLAASGNFSNTGTMPDGRIYGTATLLEDGKVLVAGGYAASGLPIASATIFDPKTGKFTPTGSMTTPRALHTATRLPDGTVLIVGGISYTNAETLGSAEIYDPQAGAFTAVAGGMQVKGNPVSLAGHTATLANGSVLIAGGFSKPPFSVAFNTDTALLYLPGSKKFSDAGVDQLVEPRSMHSATLLPKGGVLLAGGFDGQVNIFPKEVFGIIGGIRNTAEIFDPKKKASSCVGGSSKGKCKPSMSNSRAGHSATLMTAGPLKDQVLLAGGVGGKTATEGDGEVLPTAELFNSKSSKFTATGSMKSGHAFHAAAQVP